MKPSKIDIRAKDYIEQLLTSKKFVESVFNIKNINSLPQEGFSLSIFDEMVVGDIQPRIPKEVANKEKFIKSINNLLLWYGFSQDWFDFFSDYILYGFVGSIEDKKQIFLLDLGQKNKIRDEHMAILEKNTLQNPIAILLPPFASQRDIYEFVSINWNEIERIQRKYNKPSIDITSIRKKNERVKKRDHFIFKNRHLPKKELLSKIAAEFGDILDYTYINKIIVSETRKKSAGI